MDDHTRMSLFLSSLCTSWTCEEEEEEEVDEEEEEEVDEEVEEEEEEVEEEAHRVVQDSIDFQELGTLALVD